MNPHRFISAWLCIVLPFQTIAAPVIEGPPASAVTVEEIQARFPNARIVYLPESELPRLQAEAERLGATPGAARVYVVQNADDLQAVPIAPSDPRMTVAEPNRCASGMSVGTHGGVANESSVDLALQVIARSTHTRGNDDFSIVVFVIVGFVVIYALVAYAGKYFYDAYSGYRQCPKWWDITLQTGAFGGDRDGYLSSLRVSTGVEDDITRIGLTGELGRIRLNRDGESDSIESNYWMIGPAVRWYSSAANGATYVSAELLGGSGVHRNLGAMSAARIGINFPLSVRTRIGFVLGALYTDVRRTQGALAEDSNMHTLFGLELGTRF